MGYHKSRSGDCEQVVPHEGKLTEVLQMGSIVVPMEIVRKLCIIIAMMATITMRIK